MKKLAALMGMIAVAATISAHASGTVKDAAAYRKGRETPLAAATKYIGGGTPKPYKYNVTPKENQRQKRKLFRQCPHLRSKYKK